MKNTDPFIAKTYIVTWAAMVIIIIIILITCVAGFLMVTNPHKTHYSIVEKGLNEFNYQGCEYIIDSNGYGIAHKGNCTNSIHAR